MFEPQTTCASYGCKNPIELRSGIVYCNHHRFVEAPCRTQAIYEYRAKTKARRAERRAMFDAEMARREQAKTS